MNYIYRDLREVLHQTVEKALNEIGVKNFRLTDFTSGATYPTPEKINFKVHIGNSNSPVYFSINTGTYTEYHDGNYEFTMYISIDVTEDYTIYYINGGSHDTNKQLDNIVEQKQYSLGTAPIINIKEYGAHWNGWNWHGTDDKAAAEYTNQTGSALTKVDIQHIDVKEANLIIDKAASCLQNYIKDNKEAILTSRLTIDCICNHLDEFKHLGIDDWEDIKKGDAPVYYRYGTSEFRLIRKDKLDDIQYNVPYGTLMGYRRFFEYDGAIYVWFGDDEKCSLYCQNHLQLNRLYRKGEKS